MTTDRMALVELLEKSADPDFLREMLGFVAERLMALEAEGRCGAAPGERSPERTNHRNGYRDRRWRRGRAQWICAFRSSAKGATYYGVC